jgi:TM2 domain-containing membrane protein YozV
METTQSNELTPEQRQRIYLEEKARMEIRKELGTGTIRVQKSDGIAVLLSLVIPGAGQMYKEKVGAGFGWMFGVGFAYWIALYGWSNSNNTYVGDSMEGTAIFFTILGLIVHILCIVDARKSGVVAE